MVSQDTLLDRIQQLVTPILQAMGIELVELEYKREGRDWFLRFFIDKENGVTLDDCADVSREVGTLLEVEEVVDTAYRLEVSSPGLDRPLKTPADFERFKGRLVKIKTFDKLDPDGRGHERKTFVGTLLGLEAGQVTLQQTDKKGGLVVLPYAGIAKTNLEVEF